MSGELAGKTVVLTGPTSGIGLVTAREIARLGARLLLVCRDVQKGEALAAELVASGAPGPFPVVRTDFSSMQSIREGGAQVAALAPTIDVLINNAGGIFPERKVTEDGLEITFATNHVGYFLFTHVLRDHLAAAPRARVVNVASYGHKLGSIHWDDLQLERSWGTVKAYNQSKLANVLFSRELSRRLPPHVTSNSLHPGVVATNFGRQGGWFTTLVKAAAPIHISSDRGARTTVYLASSPEVAETTGKYFVRCKEAKPSRAGRDDDAARRLWEETARLCGVPA